jgi:hypothetical protein
MPISGFVPDLSGCWLHAGRDGREASASWLNSSAAKDHAMRLSSRNARHEEAAGG